MMTKTSHSASINRYLLQTHTRNQFRRIAYVTYTRVSDCFVSNSVC